MNKFKMLKGIDALVGLAVAVVLTVILVPLAGFAGGMLAGAAGTILAMQLRFYLASLDARITHRQQDIEWTVACNGVPVGSISDAEYAGICRRVYGNWRLYWLQARAYSRPFIRLVAGIFTGIPLLAFWGAVGVLLAAPEVFAATMHELSKMTASQTAATLKAMSPAVALYACGIAAAIGIFRTTNEFDQATAAEIGQHLGVVVYGRLSLISVRKTGGGVLVATDLLS
jgi:hypothetical protein